MQPLRFYAMPVWLANQFRQANRLSFKDISSQLESPTFLSDKDWRRADELNKQVSAATFDMNFDGFSEAQLFTFFDDKYDPAWLKEKDNVFVPVLEWADTGAYYVTLTMVPKAKARSALVTLYYGLCRDMIRDFGLTEDVLCSTIFHNYLSLITGKAAA